MISLSLTGASIARLSVDKGGGSTKLGVSCMNCEDPNSSKNLKVVAEFHNAPDTHDNMRIVFFEYFADQIARLSDNSAMVIVSIDSRTAAKIIPKGLPAPDSAAGALWHVDPDTLAPATEEDWGACLLKRTCLVAHAETLVGIAAFPEGGRSGEGARFFPFGAPLALGVVDDGASAAHAPGASGAARERGPPRGGEVAASGGAGDAAGSLAGIVVTHHPVLVFWAADYDFLRTLCGHTGASSTFPCIWCLISDTKIQDSSANTGDARTHAHMCSCAKSYADAVAVAGSVLKKPEAKLYFNITKAPLLSKTVFLLLETFLLPLPAPICSKNEWKQRVEQVS